MAAPKSRAQTLLKTAANAFLSLLAPENCRLCDGPLVHAAAHPVCQTCLLSVVPLDPRSCCSVCGEPLEPDAFLATGASAVRQCFACTTERPRFVRATSYALYQELRQAIHLLKFESVTTLAAPLGRMLASAMLQHAHDAPPELRVVPVPLFRGKRSFNQSTLLARAALGHVRTAEPGWKLQLDPSLLRRTRPTESQFLLSRTERRKNLRGAFLADAKVQGTHVLVIDDVYTTGTTAQECTRTLLSAGALSVRIATLARAGRDTAVVWSPMEARQFGSSEPPK